MQYLLSFFFQLKRSFQIDHLGVCLEVTVKLTQRDGMEREVGGVFRMGNTCTPMADSCQCMAKTTTIF